MDSFLESRCLEFTESTAKERLSSGQAESVLKVCTLIRFGLPTSSLYPGTYDQDDYTTDLSTASDGSYKLFTNLVLTKDWDNGVDPEDGWELTVTKNRYTGESTSVGDTSGDATPQVGWDNFTVTWTITTNTDTDVDVTRRVSYTSSGVEVAWIEERWLYSGGYTGTETHDEVYSMYVQLPPLTLTSGAGNFCKNADGEVVESYWIPGSGGYHVVADFYYAQPFKFGAFGYYSGYYDVGLESFQTYQGCVFGPILPPISNVHRWAEYDYVGNAGATTDDAAADAIGPEVYNPPDDNQRNYHIVPT